LNSTASNLSERPAAAPENANPRPSSLALWRRRISLVLQVVFLVWVGCILLIMPWSQVWTDNSLLSRNIRLHDLFNSGFVRGAVSGLGVVNLLMGFQELASVLMARRRMETMETIEQS